MEELIRYLKDTRLEGLKGLHIEGEVPVSEEQLNELIRQFVQEGSPAEPSGAAASAPGPSLNELLPYLKFPLLKVKVREGRLVLKFKVKI